MRVRVCVSLLLAEHPVLPASVYDRVVSAAAWRSMCTARLFGGHAMGTCYRCRADLVEGQIWCSTCECFQAVEGATDRCPSCGMYKPAGATLCVQCGSKIGPLNRYLTLPASTLNTLVALVGAIIVVWTTTANFIDSASSTTFQLAGLDAQTGHVRVVSINKGDRSAILVGSSLEFTLRDFAPLAEPLQLAGGGDPILEKGPTMVLLEPTGANGRWELDATLERSGHHDVDDAATRATRLIKSGSVSTCAARLMARESNGEEREQALPLSDTNCATLLRRSYGISA